MFAASHGLIPACGSYCTTTVDPGWSRRTVNRATTARIVEPRRASSASRGPSGITRSRSNGAPTKVFAANPIATVRFWCGFAAVTPASKPSLDFVMSQLAVEPE